MMIVLVLLVAAMLAGSGGVWMNAEYKGLLASTAQPPPPPVKTLGSNQMITVTVCKWGGEKADCPHATKSQKGSA